VNESVGESVSVADHIHSFDGVVWVFVEAFLGDQHHPHFRRQFPPGFLLSHLF
jgi:hypothetical protein